MILLNCIDVVEQLLSNISCNLHYVIYLSHLRNVSFKQREKSIFTLGCLRDLNTGVLGKALYMIYPTTSIWENKDGTAKNEAIEVNTEAVLEA